MYKNVKIFYFSGTGNALSATRWIAEKAEKLNIPAQNVNIECISGDEEEIKTGITSDTLLGFCFPTHGFCAPWIVLKFLWSLPRLNNPYFIVNTRAGFKTGFYGFGVTGVAHIIPILILWVKGLRCYGLMPLDMPHNWVSFFFPNFKSSIPKITQHCKQQIDRFSDQVLNRKRYYRPQIWITLPYDILLFPIAMAYLIQGRFVLAKTLYASYTCNHCRLCEINCPVQAIEIRNRRPYWKKKCESCMRCINICPLKSIQSNVTRISAILYLIFAGLTYWIDLNIYIYILLILPILFFMLYHIFWHLLAFSLFNKIITYTSLTRYWGRYLAMGVKTADLKRKE